MGIIAFALLLLTLVVPDLSAVAPAAHDRYLIDVWQTEQGLPQNHVTSITQTRDGYLWLGTYEGLARFDGIRFVTFHSARSTNLQSSRITSLFEDKTGALWIGHEHGQLTLARNGNFQPASADPAPVRRSIAAIAADGSNDIWFLRRNGTAIRQRDQLAIESLDGLTMPVLCRQSNGPLWRIHAGRMTAMRETASEERPRYHRTNDYVINAGASRDGGMWVLVGERLRKWNADGTERDAGETPWGNNPVSRLIENRSGQLWIGTQDLGLFLREPDGEFVQFNRANGLPSDWVRALYEDREGTIWVGTGGGGLCAVRKRRVAMLQSQDGWQGRGLLTASCSRTGDLWVGTEGAGLYHIGEDRFERVGPEQGLANSYVWTVLDDGHGMPWAGTWGRGLFRREADQWRAVPGLDQEGLVVTALYRGKGNDLWVGTHRGLARLNSGQVDWIGRELSSPEVRCITEASDRTVWFGMSGGGLARWRDGAVTQYRKPDGLPSDDIWCLLLGNRGDLWIGTVGGGLCRWRNGQFATISERQGLPNDVVCQIIDDQRGSLWFGTRGGIARASQRDLELCADGKIATVPFFTLGKGDGLATLECSGGSQPSHCRTPDGRFWFPTGRGLAVLNPECLSTNDLAPPVLIENLLVNGTSVVSGSSNSAPIRIPAGRQRYEFHFTALSFVAPERVRFRYQVEGMDDEWTATGQRSVTFNMIPPGHYKFRVTACNSDGVWNSSGATLAFTVLPHFWQTWWFQFATATGAAGAIAGAVRLATRRRYRRKLERMERQRAIERERSRIARDIHDDLGASLTRITLLSQTAGEELNDREVVETHLQRIYATARELTKAMDEIVWAVSPQHDTLDSLVTYLGRFAQDFTSAAGVRCRIDIPTDLPGWPVTAEVRHNLFLALKEALHNILKHAEAREIKVGLHCRARGFTLVVEDDGKGFDPIEAQQATSRLVGGHGLKNMCLRLEEIGGRCEIESRPGAGTRIRFHVESAK
jgi:signal transduction histidine kinase/ligand-binding sensor domain-containing protein